MIPEGEQHLCSLAVNQYRAVLPSVSLHPIYFRTPDLQTWSIQKLGILPARTIYETDNGQRTTSSLRSSAIASLLYFIWSDLGLLTVDILRVEAGGAGINHWGTHVKGQLGTNSVAMFCINVFIWKRIVLCLWLEEMLSVQSSNKPADCVKLDQLQQWGSTSISTSTSQSESFFSLCPLSWKPMDQAEHQLRT